jgi:hypothetical protein
LTATTWYTLGAVLAIDADRLGKAHAEIERLRVGISEAMRQISEWMDPGSDAPLFDPGHAAEVERTLKKYIGEHVIASLST